MRYYTKIMPEIKILFFMCGWGIRRGCLTELDRYPYFFRYIQEFHISDYLYLYGCKQ